MGQTKPISTYFIGGCVAVLVVGLIGSLAYCAVWMSNNKWRNFQYGHQQSVKTIAIAIIVLSAVAFVFVMASFCVHLGCDHSPCTALVWIIAFLLTAAVIAVEAYGLRLTRFGDTPVWSTSSYWDDDPVFKFYYDNWMNHANVTITEAVPDFVNKSLAADTLITGPWSVPAGTHFRDYYVEFVKRSTEKSPYETVKITSCAMNWGAILEKRVQKLGGPGPCSYGFEESDALECIGDWTPVKFQEYWCHLYKKEMIPDKEWEEKEPRSDSDRKEREARRDRARKGVDTLSAFYGHITYFIAILGASWFIGIITVIVDYRCGDSEPDRSPSSQKQKKQRLVPPRPTRSSTGSTNSDRRKK